MSELKAYIAPTPDGTGLADYYIKSEADKVIAGKDEEIRRLRRALYKACSNWMTDRQVAMACYHLEARARKFDKAIAKCQAKMEEYR